MEQNDKWEDYKMGCDHVAAVCRKALAMSAALNNGDIKEALGGHHPRVIRRDPGPVSKKKAVQSLVAYLDGLRGVSTRVRSYKRGLLIVYLGDIKVLVQVNCREEEIFNKGTVTIKITGRDIEHGKLSRSAGTLILNRIWLSAPVTERIALAEKNGV